MEFFSGKSKQKPQKKNLKSLKKIKLSPKEVKRLLSLFNRINIINIENENAIWKELLDVAGPKQSQKILNCKYKFLKFCMKFESKLRKIMKLMNNDSSYAAKEKLLVSGLVFLELLCHDDKEDFEVLEKLDFNKSSFKEYVEATKFIRENVQNPKKSKNSQSITKFIEKKLERLFQSIAKFKRKILDNNKKTESIENLQDVIVTPSLKSKERFSSKSQTRSSKTLSNRVYYFDTEEEMKRNFEEYLRWKKYEVVEELAIDKNHDEFDKSANKKIPIEKFIDDKDFREFIVQINRKKTAVSFIDDDMVIEQELVEEPQVLEVKDKIANFQEIEMSSYKGHKHENKGGVLELEDKMMKGEEEKNFLNSYNASMKKIELGASTFLDRNKFNETGEEIIMPSFVRNIDKKESEESEGDARSDQDEGFEQEMDDINSNDTSSSGDEI